MRYYIIAGEASGDLHASKLMRELKKQDADADFRFWGGDLMAAHGGTPVKHYKELAFMGLMDVIMNLRAIKRNFKFCKSDILSYKPDVLILVDYPGFNLRMAEFAHKNNITTHYYISPKVWAWKKKRAYKIKRTIDKLFVIFPFEIDFYKNYDYPVEYVGNPVIDAVDEALETLPSDAEFRKKHRLSGKPIIALLPGSRKQELKHNFPIMLGLAKYFPDYQFVVAAALSLEKAFIRSFITDEDVHLVYDATYSVLKSAQAAVVTSGTATLEAALIGTPQLVCYKGDYISYQVARRVVDVKWISLVNLVANKEVIKEYIQYDMTDDKLQSELDKLLFDTDYRQKMSEGYHKIREVLGDRGASARTAKIIYESLQQSAP